MTLFLIILALIATHALAFIIGAISNSRPCVCQDRYDDFGGYETTNIAKVELPEREPAWTKITVKPADQAERLRELFRSEN